MDDTQREQIAVFRHGVIRDLVAGPLAPGEKERLLTEITERDWTIPGTSRRRVGRSTARDWVTLYECHGFEGLKPARRGDVGSSRTIPVEIQEMLLELRKARPEASTDSLIRAVHLALPDAQVRLARTTVYRFLAANAPKPRVAEGSEPDARAFTHEHPGDLWVADVMHGPRLVVKGRRERPRTYLHAFLDDATRVVPFAAFYNAENAACFTDAFKQALLRRGVPRRLYCDNGATYRTQHLQVVCATLNVALIHSRPYKPRGRGKVERFFRHVRSSFLPHVTPEMVADLSALNRVFWAWLEGEYHQTPHRGLEGATPMDRFLAGQDHVRPAPEEVDQLLRMKVTRRVGRDRTVRLEGRLYEAPDGWAGEKVEVLFDPYDPLAPVAMRTPDGEAAEIRLRQLDLVTNAKLPRPAREPAEAPEPATTGISYLDLIAKRFYGDDGEGQ